MKLENSRFRTNEIEDVAALNFDHYLVTVPRLGTVLTAVLAHIDDHYTCNKI